MPGQYTKQIVLPLAKEAHEQLFKMNKQLFMIAEHNAADLSFYEIYSAVFTLTYDHGAGAVVQRSLRHAARALSMQCERRREIGASMLRDVAMYHQRTWLVATREKDVRDLVKEGALLRERKALRALERAPGLWRKYMHEVFWPPGGVYEQRTAKRARWNGGVDGAN